MTGRLSISLAFSSDGRELATISMRGFISGRRGMVPSEVKLWDLESRRELRTINCDGTCAAFSPDGKLLAIGTYDGTVKIWARDSGEEIRTCAGHSGTVTVVRFSPDGQRIVSGSADQTIKVWDVVTGLAAITLRGHTGPITDIALDGTGRRIASASEDGTVRVWEALDDASGH